MRPLANECSVLSGLRQKLKQKCFCFVAPVLASEILFQGQHLFHIVTTTIAPPAQDSAVAAALIVEVQGWLVSEDGWPCAANCGGSWRSSS